MEHQLISELVKQKHSLGDQSTNSLALPRLRLRHQEHLTSVNEAIKKGNVSVYDFQRLPLRFFIDKQL